MNRQIVLWGATGQAKVLWELFEHTGDRVVAVFENNRQIRELSHHKSVPIYYEESGFLKWASLAHPELNEIYGLAAIGGSRGQDRMAIQTLMQAHHVRPITAIHPTAFVAADVQIGDFVRSLPMPRCAQRPSLVLPASLTPLHWWSTSAAWASVCT